MEEIPDYYPLEKLNFADSQKKFDYFTIDNKDKKTLRELAKKIAYIADNQIHEEKISLWKDLNSLKEVRPLVWINEIPWHEMDVNNELKLKTKTNFSQFIETRLRRTIYIWKHMKADFIIEPILSCYKTIDNSGFGISEKIEKALTDKHSDIISRKFIPQIQNEDDIEKIKFPEITLDKNNTFEKYQAMVDLFEGILTVEEKGMPGFWFAPWDELVRWLGVEKALIDLIAKPDLIHKVMERLTQAYLYLLGQYEDKNLLTLNNCNYRIGSGGLGYTDELPGKNYDSSRVRASNMWGCGAAQIFSGVSPEMHYEFALSYEIKWMEKFGLNYYGCCEPLEKKLGILKKIPNLRKISMSSWVDLEQGAEALKDDYVFSYKPSPSIFSLDYWDATAVREKLIKDLKKIKNCKIEIIMKDISTVKNQPVRLWEWAKIAMEVVQEL